MKTLFKAAVLASLVMMALAAVACNTTKGFGKDVEKAGEGLQNSADKHGAN